MNTENAIGKALKIIGTVIIALGILAALFTIRNSVILALIYVVSTIISGTLIMGLGEIINLLQQNVDKTTALADKLAPEADEDRS